MENTNSIWWVENKQMKKQTNKTTTTTVTQKNKNKTRTTSTKNYRVGYKEETYGRKVGMWVDINQIKGKKFSKNY